MRYAEQTRKVTESGSETESIVPNFIESTSASQRIDPITVLTASPSGRFYCCGTEYGTVRLFETKRGKLLNLHVSKSFLSIEQWAWSHNGHYICFSDCSKKVHIMSMISGTIGSDPIIEPKAETSS